MSAATCGRRDNDRQSKIARGLAAELMEVQEKVGESLIKKKKDGMAQVVFKKHHIHKMNCSCVNLES